MTFAHIWRLSPLGSARLPLRKMKRNGRSRLPAPASLSALAAFMVYVYVISVYCASVIPRELLPRAQMSASCSARPFASSGGYVLKSSWRITCVFSSAFWGSTAQEGMARRVRRVTWVTEESASAAR